MSIEPIDLGFIASWPASAGPQDPDVITGSGPWGPRVTDAFPVRRDPAVEHDPTPADYVWLRANRPDLIRLAELVESGPEQRARTADVLADVEATIARHGRDLKAVA